MKIKPTPLLFVTAGYLLYALYMFFIGTEKSGPLTGLFLMIKAIVAILVYFILNAVFRKYYRIRIVVEVLLITGVFFAEYKRNGAIVLNVPENYTGFVILVYDVENAPALSRKLFSNKIFITVPESGVITTSSARNEYSNLYTEINKNRCMHISYYCTSITCNAQKYPAEVWLCGDDKYMADKIIIHQENEAYHKEKDTIAGLKQKIEQTCTEIFK